MSDERVTDGPARVPADDYLDAICDAYEAWEKKIAHPPDPPTPEDMEEHDDECGSLWFRLTEAIEEACSAREGE